MLPLKVARVKPGKVCAGVPATLPVAVAPMLAHDALRMQDAFLLSMVCAGHARLSSYRIATAMMVRLSQQETSRCWKVPATRSSMHVRGKVWSMRSASLSLQEMRFLQRGLQELGGIWSRRCESLSEL